MQGVDRRRAVACYLSRVSFRSGGEEAALGARGSHWGWVDRGCRDPPSRSPGWGLSIGTLPSGGKPARPSRCCMLGLRIRLLAREAGLILDSAYITYWSLRDPLCQSQSLPIVRSLVRRGYRMALVTFEQSAYSLTAAERANQKGLLERDGILWRPLTYHKRPRILATLWDIVAGAFQATTLQRAYHARLLHGRGTVAAAMASIAARSWRSKFFNDADGPLSEEYVDAGVWGRGSIGHRLTSFGERRSLATADAVAVLSSLRRDEAQQFSRSRVEVLPCAVDTAQFVRDSDVGRAMRRELDLRGTVLAYSGKAGGWYRSDLLFSFAQAFRQAVGDSTLLVLTTDAPESFLRPANEAGVPCVVRRATREEMPGYLSAADVGLSFRLATSSQTACSPVKNGEYLACGLPVVMTPVCGDYPALAEGRGVGLVLRGERQEELRAAARQLGAMLREPDLASRCRNVAVSEVGLSEVVVPRYIRIYEALLGPPRRE